jgi:hypothetical protein
LILAVAALALAPARLPPVDRCSIDPSFRRFRAELASTVQRRDARALLGIVADDVMVDFDSSRGPREFARVWRLDGKRGAQSGIWRELRTVMTLGCAPVGSARFMPSLVAQLGDAEPLETFVALPGAGLRNSPRNHSPVTARLSFHVVKLEGSWPPGTWAHVALSDGRSGYVRSTELRNALQWRAQFEKVAGRWRLMSFVDGD